ncbi:hypothetical protein [Qipengyuania sp. MTN3-11]|uniref:hypothetical protein n=1 Tax=Qipengyuania sp. MTN3-11 TaxID=3056557 RepID=UPI0036F2CDA7
MFRFGINATPVPRTDFTISTDSLASAIDDPIAIFPIALPDIEDAFPVRFLREDDGRLARNDARPVNSRGQDRL